ncbi:hypothetical protein Ancab_024490 [Ancistrocladus abbreviatus]
MDHFIFPFCFFVYRALFGVLVSCILLPCYYWSQCSLTGKRKSSHPDFPCLPLIIFFPFLKNSNCNWIVYILHSLVDGVTSLTEDYCHLPLLTLKYLSPFGRFY